MGIKAGLVAPLLSFASCISRRTLFQKINDQIGLKFCSDFSIVGSIFFFSGDSSHFSIVFNLYTGDHIYDLFIYFFYLPYCFISLTSLQFNI